MHYYVDIDNENILTLEFLGPAGGLISRYCRGLAQFTHQWKRVFLCARAKGAKILFTVPASDLMKRMAYQTSCIQSGIHWSGFDASRSERTCTSWGTFWIVDGRDLINCYKISSNPFIHIHPSSYTKTRHRTPAT